MRLHLCGVRGSTAAPGADFVRYGGHTSCVTVAHDGEAPTVVLDAGTGLRNVSGPLAGEPFRGAILLTHLHWDHTHGLPFFGAGDRDDSQVALYLPEQGDPVEVLRRSMSPPHFPIDPLGLRGSWTFSGLEAGTHEIEGFEVTALDVPHKGGRTFGYRVSDGRTTIAYLPDHGPIALGEGPEGFGPYHEAALALADGVDVLFHDSQHLAEEFPRFAEYGHSSIDYAVGLAEAAGAQKLVLFHHDPHRTDDQLDEIVEKLRGSPITIDTAHEGAFIEL